ncbi:hypothetical protein [Marinifilum fragile]|uniref:hypothetical protein n=1 Tax=Marinifilum fragile TaxID=570161 RepID=UPI002AA7ABDD|nr:hypothetical protein [Marinifilum fragile]
MIKQERHTACIPASGIVLPERNIREVKSAKRRLVIVKTIKLKGEKQLASTTKNSTSPAPRKSQNFSLLIPNLKNKYKRSIKTKITSRNRLIPKFNSKSFQPIWTHD